MPQPLGDRGISPIDSLGRKNYRKWKTTPTMQPPSRGDINLPLGQGCHYALEVASSAGVALTGPVVIDPLLVVIFLFFSVITPHR